MSISMQGTEVDPSAARGRFGAVVRIAARAAAALGLVAALTVASGSAKAAWTVVFRDDGRSQWQQLHKLVGPSCNKITREAASLRVKSCAVGTPGSQTAMVWPKVKITVPSVKIEFEYTHYSAQLVTDGSMSALMVLASGDGTSGYPTDVTTWGAQCCATPLTSIGYAPHMRAVQINFAYRNDPRGNLAIRVRGLKGAVGSYQLLGESGALFPFTDFRAYKITVVRTGPKLTISAKDKVTGTTNTFVISHPYIASLGAGWMGFRQMQARDSKFGNVQISVDK